MVQRQLRTVSRFTWWTLAALAVVMLQPWEWRNPVNRGQADWLAVGVAAAAVAVVLGLFAAMIVGFVSFQNRDLRQQRAELLAWKAAVGAGSPD